MKNESTVKEIYVLNLDKNRIMILSGLFVLLLGAALTLGMALGKNSVISVASSSDTIVEEGEGDKLAAALEEHSQEKTDEGAMPSGSLDILPPLSEDVNPVIEPGESALPVKNDPLTPPAPLAKSSSNTNSSFYTIQVAAYKNESQARRLEGKLKQEGLSARVERGTLYWFVRVGKAESKSALRTDLQKLQEMKFDVLLKKVIS